MGWCNFSMFDLIFSIVVLYAVHSRNDARILHDGLSLLSFMSGITNDPQNSLLSWRSSYPSSAHNLSQVCEWSGVGCDANKNRVVELNLSHKSLHGTISPALFNLSELQILDLSGNFFQGWIPVEIGSLSNLVELSLSTNLLVGKIPAELGFLKELVYLNLGSNKLSGEIPTSLFCNGSSSLQYLDLSNNSLTGEIPLDNGCDQLKELKYLLLWSNRLVGEVPLALSNSSKLEWLDLEQNLLTGELPYEVFASMSHLKFLYLSYNNFSSHNGNTDLNPFFASLVNSSNLQEIDLAGNNLGGELPSIIGDLSALVQINLDSNLIHGPIPPQISRLVNLTLLNLSNNFLDGSVPSELCQMGRLERLILSNNSLSGDIPSTLWNTPHLGLLDLSKNKLSGTIPDSLCEIPQLRKLLLYENQLLGSIPQSIGKCRNLEILDLSHNRISGEIPNEVSGLTGLTLYLNLSSNLLSGNILLELSKMDMVLAIDLSSNNLTGPLPSQLGSCTALENLNLSNNALEGQFPGSIGTLPYLKELDVSFNMLSGELPISLQASSSLKAMNFSYNNFCGNVNNEGAFSSLTINSFIGNGRLCGSVKGLQNCHRKRPPRRHFLMAILLSLLITPMFCIAGYPLVLRSKYRKEQLPVSKGKDIVDEEEARSEEIKYPRISRRQLIQATGGFSGSSLVGSGRFGHVYKGILQDNTKIAVKVINSKAAGEIAGSFKRECQVLKRTRHRNLIRIITTCSRPDFKALVLPLMQNGSLENHLYPSHGSKHGLDLMQLVSICSDVAEGMAYLHHHAPVKVVHCDLKPSNILLDDDMTALVTDFGIARLVKGADPVDESGSYDSTDGLLCGSVGYIAPEYGMGKHASTQGDVYSYGVLILEIVTGKRPTDILFQEGSNMHEWIRSRYPNRLETIMEEAMERCAPRATMAPCDKKIWRDVILELIEIGLICTQHNPAIRPTMLDIAGEISLLKQYLCSPSTLATEQTQTNCDILL
ncbi:putative leucine-rich repeat receptor-like serine/threonine-protein kinase At2g24130 [Andrographis paniculata]|uniref:putative leucine-rich repeat receptor-like serine/threonine-protein kinase At2g24130 n=1 Tax=Andrographis paniculata TaxID=175694 RepID=UPI0021E81EAE|nr:putative leucine-rich repeat receptor-like serine/threonine-protein kinase At2g24130 [Andrographis paniculata]